MHRYFPEAVVGILTVAFVVCLFTGRETRELLPVLAFFLGILLSRR